MRLGSPVAALTVMWSSHVEQDGPRDTSLGRPFHQADSISKPDGFNIHTEFDVSLPSLATVPMHIRLPQMSA